MNYLRDVGIFGGLGLLGCLIMWFGVRLAWSRPDNQKTANLGPEKMKRLEHGLAAGLVLAEVGFIAVGLGIAASGG